MCFLDINWQTLSFDRSCTPPVEYIHV